MMKIRLLLFLTVILVFGCDVSEDLVSQSNRNIQMKILNESMLQNHPLALQKLSEIHQKSESLQRIIQADSIIIDTDYCKYIVVDGIESYTFGIYRESPPKNLLENLVLTKHKNDSISAVLYQYNLTEPEQHTLLKGVLVYLENKIRIIRISDESLISDLSAKISSHDLCWDYSFVTVPGNPCIQGNHMFGDPDCSYTNPNSQLYHPALGPTPPTTDVVLIPSSCGGSGGNSNPTTNPYNPTYGSGATSPTSGPPKLSLDGDPCSRLKNATSSAEYKQKFKDLDKPANYSAQQESGFGQIGNNYVDLIPNGDHELIPPSGCKNFTHVHNNKPFYDELNEINRDLAVKVPSPADLLTLIRICQPTNENPTEAFMVMISDEGIFALTILEPIQIATFGANWTTFVKNYKDRSKNILNDVNNSPNSRKEALEKMILQELKTLGLGNKIGLFEGKVENQNSSDINTYKINWTRKTLNETSKKVNKEPCK